MRKREFGIKFHIFFTALLFLPSLVGIDKSFAMEGKEEEKPSPSPKGMKRAKIAIDISNIIKESFNPDMEKRMALQRIPLQFDSEREAFYEGMPLSKVNLPMNCTKPLIENADGVIFSLPSTSKNKNKNQPLEKKKREKKSIEEEKYKPETSGIPQKIDGAESILGSVDRRHRVIHPYKDPYRIHGHLYMTFHENTFYIGSGTLISGKFIITAGHNLYAPEHDQVAEKITFYPGKNGKYKYWHSDAEMIAIHPDWYNKGLRGADIGIVMLKDNLKRQVGNLEPVVVDFQDKDNLKMNINITGYPGSPGNGNEMYTMEGLPISVKDGTRLFYDIDTSPGQSGSGVWTFDENGSPICVAVHTYGGVKGIGNSGTLINEEKLLKIYKWITSLRELKNNANIKFLQNKKGN